MNFLEQVRDAGVIGCGGAGFPTHVKWNTTAEYLIVNAVECEPLLCTDRYLIRTFADRIIRACLAAAEQIHAQKIVIAIKKAYESECKALKNAIEAHRANIEIHMMESFYPAGDEQVVVREVTGRTVPFGGIPLDVGAVVSNAATLLAASDAMDGAPLIEKYITVTGAVRSPCIIKAPIGTPVAECIRMAGGALTEDALMIAGGPMMGQVISDKPEREQAVTKTTSGLLVFSRESYMGTYRCPMDLQALRKKAAAACIQCSYCTMLCPRHLLGHPLEPHRIMRMLARKEEITALLQENPTMQNAAYCSNCGVCTVYACPMGLQPSRVNAFLKEEMSRMGLRGAKGPETEPLDEREWRKVPTGRLTARLGALHYEGQCANVVREVIPAQVTISLRQGAGKAAEPIVKKGDAVTAGSLIAEIPNGALGSRVHASISGTVTEVSGAITIVGG